MSKADGGREIAIYYDPQEQRRRILRSEGFAAGYRGDPRPTVLAGVELQAWSEGYAAAEFSPDDHAYLATIAAGRAGRPPLVVSGENDDAPVSDRWFHHGAIPLAGDHSRDVPAGADVLRLRAGDSEGGHETPAPQLADAKPSSDPPAVMPEQPVAPCVRPLENCGIVVVVDYLNLLVRAFHASPPSRINGVRGMLETVGSVIDRLSPEYLIFAMDGGYRHRTELLPSYKAHRGPKPPGLQEQIDLGQEVLEALGWPSIRVQDFEADDVIASLATQLDPFAAGMFIASSDKDLIQLLASTSAVIHQPWNGGTFVNAKACVEKYGIGPKQLGDYLALVGDSSDGVPGVKGIGPKKAAELLTTHGTLDQVLEAARTLRIPGAAGKNLREQTDAARLSRALVTLRADLPIGTHWQNWPLAEPRSGWKASLVKMGLGGPAQKLAQRLADGRDRGALSAQARIEYAGVIDSFAEVTLVPVPQEGPFDGTAFQGSGDDDREDRRLSSHEVEIDDTCGGIGKAGGAEGQQPGLDIHPGAAAARRVYDQAFGLRHLNPVGGYHVGTLLRLAWDTALAGEPFESIPFQNFDHHGKPISVATKKPSLFGQEAA